MGSHWCGDKLWSPPLPKDLVGLLLLHWIWGSAALQTQEPTSLWKNFPEQGWGGTHMISCFLMTPGSVSPAVPPEDRHRRPYTAPWSSGGAGDGARLERGPWTGFKVQGHSGTGTGCSRAVGSWPGSAAGLDKPQPEAQCRCLLVPGRTRHLQPRSVFWEGVRMQMGDAQAQELWQLHTSRSWLGSVPVPAGSAAGVIAQEFTESLWWLPGLAVPSRAGASLMLQLPEPGGERCWCCANTTGMGLEVASANTDSPKICWHGQSASGPGLTPVLQEPGPVLMATRAGCAQGAAGPHKAPCGAKALACPHSQLMMLTRNRRTTTESSSGCPGAAPGSQG